MNLLELLPKEQLIETFEVQYSKQKVLYPYRLFITTIRIATAPIDGPPDLVFSLYDVEYQHAPISEPPIFATKIKDPNHSKVVRFASKQQQDTFTKVTEMVKLQKNELTCLKYKILAE